MRINHNITALNTYRQLSSNNESLAKTTEKLSSGLRINRAGDDAAGLAISEKMRGQIRGLDQAARNGQDGISLIQTAEGALNETQSILQRMRELAVQSSSDTNTAGDRQNLQKEVDQLATEITRISNTTEFNKQTLLNGGVKTGNIGADSFQIGANAGQTMSVDINAMDAASLGVGRDVKTATLATGATDVTSVSLSPTVGTGVTSGAVLTLTSSATAALGADATTKLQTVSNTSQYNGYTVTVSTTSASNSFAIDNTAKTITIGLTAATNTVALQNAAIQAQPGGSDFSFSAVAVAGSGTLSGGLASDEVKLSMASSGLTETAIVKNNASTVTFSDPAKFNGVTLSLDGSLTATTAATINVSTATAKAATFSNGAKTADAISAGGIDVSSSASAASNAITAIDKAVVSVSSERAKLGAFQNRLEHTINNLSTSSENLSAAESRIRDTDMAKTMMEQTKNNILAQAAQAMLAQANQQPQGVLQLLR